MATGPSRCGESRLVRKIAVGPSAPPMIPMDAASKRLKLIPGTQSDNSKAPMSVLKIPNWAAPPRRAVFGSAIMGPKSVMAPTPIKTSRGSTPVLIPTS